MRRARAEGLWDVPQWGAWEQLRHGTLPDGQGRAGLGCPSRGAVVTWHHQSRRCVLYRCVPDVELGVQSADGERQMELVLCDVVPVWLFGVGWRAAGLEEVGREALVSSGARGRTRRAPAPRQGLAFLPMPCPPRPGLQKFCGAFTRGFTLAVAESLSCPVGFRVIPAASHTSWRAGSAQEQAWACHSG